MVVTGKTSGASSSMNIKGTLDTGDIDRGFTRVEKGFEKTKGQAKSFGSDMSRVSSTVKGLSNKLLIMGATAATALIGIASKAPAVAPALAKMGVAFGKIQRNLGEALAPAFEKVSGWLDKVAAWSGSHPDIFSGIVISLSAIAALKFVGAGGFLAALGKLVIAPKTLTALGYIAAIGAVAYAGYKASEVAVDAAHKYVGMGTDPDAPTDMFGQTLANRLTQKVWADITGVPAPWEDPLNPFSPAHDQAIAEIGAAGYQPTPGGEVQVWDRRSWFLQLWDSIWG